MSTANITEIQLQINLVNLKNLQDLLKIGEVVNVEVLDINQNEATINLKGSIIKAFSNTELEKNSTLKLLVTRLEPFVELKILNVGLKENFYAKTINNILSKTISNDIEKFILENADEKKLSNYIKTSFETITSTLLNNNIHLNENVFVVIAYYIGSWRLNLYVNSRKKLTKQKKLRQTLTVFCETLIGLIKINIIKIDSIWVNLWIYKKSAYELLLSCKDELENYVKVPIKIIFKKNKPSIETLKTISYLDVFI